MKPPGRRCNEPLRPPPVPAHATPRTGIIPGFAQLVESRAHSATRKGVVDPFRESRYGEGPSVVYDVQFTRENLATASNIAWAFAGKGASLIHSRATPTSQVCVHATKTIPIAICSLTEPIGTGRAMGIGIIVAGPASVILDISLAGSHTFPRQTLGAVCGSPPLSSTTNYNAQSGDVIRAKAAKCLRKTGSPPKLVPASLRRGICGEDDGD